VDLEEPERGSDGLRSIPPTHSRRGRSAGALLRTLREFRDTASGTPAVVSSVIGVRTSENRNRVSPRIITASRDERIENSVYEPPESDITYFPELFFRQLFVFLELNT